MGVFDKALKTAKNIKHSVSGTMNNVSSNIGSSAQDNSELATLRMQINVIEQELNAAYCQIGKKYIDCVMETGDMGNLDVSDLLKILDPKITRKMELEAKIVEIEKRIKQNDVLREQSLAQEEFDIEKAKLDKALAMDVISQEEYDEKLYVAKRKLDNFQEIRRIEQQFQMGIITKSEKSSRINELTKKNYNTQLWK